MFSAVLTDGETLGWLPWKAVINTTWEAAASALTPCRGCLLGPRSRGQCLPFTPRYSCPLPWPYPAGTTCTPWDGKPISAPRPSSPTHHSPSLLPHSRYLCPNTLSLQPSRLLHWVVSLPAPIIVLHSVSYRCLHSGDFCFESLRRKVRWPWRECLCLLELKRKENALWKSSFMSLIDRRLPEWFFLTVITKIRMGLNASSLGEWKWSSPGERKTGPLARLHGLSLMLLAWHGELTLTGSFIQTHAKSPGTGGAERQLLLAFMEQRCQGTGNHLYLKLSMACHSLSGNPKLINIFFLHWAENSKWLCSQTLINCPSQS